MTRIGGELSCEDAKNGMQKIFFYVLKKLLQSAKPVWLEREQLERYFTRQLD